MRHQFARRITFALVLLLSVSLCFDEAFAQRKRNKRSRRATNPVTVTPVAEPQQPATEPQIISTADQQASEQNNASGLNERSSTPSIRRKENKRVAETDNQDSVQRTVNDLSTKMAKLSDKMNQVEQHLNFDLLLRAEQRADALHIQLDDVQAKQADLQAQIAQIEYESKPENIERAVATIGTTHPEQAREARRQALENEKNRITTRLSEITTNRQRLEATIAIADQEVEKLRKRIDEANEGQPATKTNTTENSTENTGDTEGTSTTPATNTPPPSSNPPQP